MPKQRDVSERLSAHIIRTPGGCWRWMGSVDRDGYGRIQHEGQSRTAHRVMMISLGFDVTGLDVDHLCRNRRCVNPAHLDPVTRGENNRRKWKYGPAVVRHHPVTHCKSGHIFDESNTYVHRGRRNCRACNREAQRRRQIATKKENA